MNDLFGGVVYAGIDTDRYKYPIGSGRVTFGNQKSFMKAVKAGFVEIKTPKFSKKVRGQGEGEGEGRGGELCLCWQSVHDSLQGAVLNHSPPLSGPD